MRVGVGVRAEARVRVRAELRDVVCLDVDALRRLLRAAHVVAVLVRPVVERLAELVALLHLASRRRGVVLAALAVTTLARLRALGLAILIATAAVPCAAAAVATTHGPLPAVDVDAVLAELFRDDNCGT